MNQLRETVLRGLRQYQDGKSRVIGLGGVMPGDKHNFVAVQVSNCSYSSFFCVIRR